MPDNHVDRDGLLDRQIPEMILSDGAASSLTAPPPPIPHYLSAAGRAQYRFAVEGNAIITGGAGTLALEAARALCEHGLAGLALFDINPTQSQDHIDKLKEDFPSVKIMTKSVNVTVVDEISAAVADVRQTLGSVDILCCFAGVVGCTHAMDMSPEEWRRTIDINSTGSFLSAQAVARVMQDQGTGGVIVFIASMSGHRVNYPQPQSAYNVSKASLIHLKSCLAAEWARYGIRVNSISPGYMDTILNEGPGLEEARKIWAERNPMGRMGSPQELCGPLVLLCSNAGTYINGTDLLVDGGQTVF
ncbi:NAD(P)-binding protein [Pseudovirgaria hyperparasitica]|uniref:D-arabinitol 2-dehydrogenase [ribulose-forming] n=1 Tax=Pseudovirgaria hyperparasitica TaxID=470096 RepID=A0A6A6WEA7_9PEZI|nr:NAD(P)-binding protein [Pseudovirgaria hyperparasitica]KAF2760364.1 NAD(P)-binding protein [Pseudovirgaria hyperparasitica]